MEISKGAYGAFELETVCAEILALACGAPRRRQAFAVLLACPWIASNSWLGQSFRPTSEFRARGKLSWLPRSLLKRQDYS